MYSLNSVVAVVTDITQSFNPIVTTSPFLQFRGVAILFPFQKGDLTVE